MIKRRDRQRRRAAAGHVAALLWINVDSSSYRSVWETDLACGWATTRSLDLRGWLNSGLMTLFFFVVGLEARREFDMGELRQRRRVALPCWQGSAAWSCRC